MSCHDPKVRIRFNAIHSGVSDLERVIEFESTVTFSRPSVYRERTNCTLEKTCPERLSNLCTTIVRIVFGTTRVFLDNRYTIVRYLSVRFKETGQPSKLRFIRKIKIFFRNFTVTRFQHRDSTRNPCTVAIDKYYSKFIITLLNTVTRSQFLRTRNPCTITTDKYSPKFIIDNFNEFETPPLLRTCNPRTVENEDSCSIFIATSYLPVSLECNNFRERELFVRCLDICTDRANLRSKVHNTKPRLMYRDLK